MERIVLAVVVLCVFGCAGASPPTTPAPRQAAYIESEYAPYLKPGTGAIIGQVFLRTRGGDVKVGAGSRVDLNPVTAYSTEWWHRDVFGGEHLAPADSRTDLTYRNVTADGEGRFVFDSLPPGQYFIESFVSWEYYAGREGLKTSGGRVGQRVQIANGQRVTIALNELKDR